jgi:hypothetical protein
MKLKLRMFGGKITRVSINICTTMENKRGEAWTHEETVLLIELWGDQRVQEQLENTHKRNLEILKRICQDIKDRLPDFSRSAQDCRARIKRLKTKYFQTRRDNNKSGGKRKTFPYDDRLDGLLGTRPTGNPLLDSLIYEDEQDSDNETLISIFITICLQLHRYLSQIGSVFIAV